MAVDLENHLISTDIWNDKAFQALSPEAKTCFIYLISAAGATLWGIQPFNLIRIAADLSCSQAAAQQLLEELHRAGLVRWLPDRSLLWVPDWWNYHGIADEEARDYCLSRLEEYKNLHPDLKEFVETSQKILRAAPPYPG
jgi:hypothetical protein